MSTRDRRRAGGIVGAVLTAVSAAATAATAAAAATPQPATAACRLDLAADLPVTMLDSRPTVEVGINGAKARFVLDSGVPYSQTTPAQAADLHMKVRTAPFMNNVPAYFARQDDGRFGDLIAVIKRFTVGGRSIDHFELALLAGETGDGTAGLLGQDFLGAWDVEYDLGQGAVRLFDPKGCRQGLAYWTAPGETYSTLVIDWPEATNSLTVGVVQLNGVDVRAIFDTGAPFSVLALSAAKRAGMRLDSPGVVADGGSGPAGATAKAYVAPFASLKVGDREELRDVRLRVADVAFGSSLTIPRLSFAVATAADAEMLLGADFFLAHRILVANSERRLYLTYNGGPPFNTQAGPHTAPPSGTTPPPSDTVPPARMPHDASGFARRGAALASRGEFTAALADLDRACKLAPSEAEYFYLRGGVRRRAGQPAEALRDFDQAVALRPDYVQALMARAQLRDSRGDGAGALADARAVDGAVTERSAWRFDLGSLYEGLGQWNLSIRQFDLWLEHHPRDPRWPWARLAGCWLRAQANEDLDVALQDCDAVLRRAPMNSRLRRLALESRGFVYLRTGRNERALADFDGALAGAAPSATALYGRGVAKTRLGQAADGQADLAAAAELQPQIAGMFAARGITSP